LDIVKDILLIKTKSLSDSFECYTKNWKLSDLIWKNLRWMTHRVPVFH